MSLAEPKIICIMPCYNAEKTLAKAIESITKQNYINWELIIVDDASTDKSVRIAKNYLKDPRVTLLQNKTNRGCYYSINRALYHVKDQNWDWFTGHGADDTSHPDRFGIFMAWAFHGRYDYLYSGGQGNRYDWKEQRLIFRRHNGNVGTAFISKASFKLLGYFDSSTRFGGDAEYAYRLKQIVATSTQLELGGNTLNWKQIMKFLRDSKQAIGNLPSKFCYLYTWGYDVGNNLTQIIPGEERLEYAKNFEEKWGKGGIHIDDFYINFTPNQEDL